MVGTIRGRLPDKRMAADRPRARHLGNSYMDDFAGL